MTKHSDTIIINGQHFNARTGLPVTAKPGAAKKVRTVDGILPQHVTATVLAKPVHYTQPLKTVVKKPVMDVTREPARNLPKRSLQPGQTLMRQATAKPAHSLKRHTKVLTANPAKAGVTVAHVTPKTSAAVIDSRKLQHANDVARSKLISRFTEATVVSGPTVRLTAAASHAVVASQQAAYGLAKQPSLDLFERALAKAKSHEQATPKHVKRTLKQASKQQRRLNLAASGLACLLLVAFIAYQNMPNIKFQYASSRAGFHAALPGYRPAGFSVGKLNYQAGTVSVSFHSNSDDRSFAITQKPSGWDSQTLRENFVATNGQQYHTAEAGGRTIYLYGDSNATWVNGGVWYQVTTAGSLNERQLTQLASSM
ncbi:MAG: hypothetical protein QFB87_05505 [Patescibacteria group bacterium]|nr:hypothetical protein [Patescibacteria group bacterium]